MIVLIWCYELVKSFLQKCPNFVLRTICIAITNSVNENNWTGSNILGLIVFFFFLELSMLVAGGCSYSVLMDLLVK